MGGGHHHGAAGSTLMDPRPLVIRYAEDVLHVNADYDNARQINDQLGLVIGRTEQLEMKIRNTGDLIDIVKDQLTVLINEEMTSSDENHSGAAIERAIRLAVAKDETIAQYTRDIMVWREELANLRGEKASLTLAHATTLARMNQTGGLLNVMAAVKNAESNKTSSLPF